jgi:hypothetical protein
MTTEHTETIKRALTDADVPKLYANNFVCSLSVSDLSLIGRRNDSAEFVLNLSYTSAKSLQQLLGEMIEKLESHTGQAILTTKMIEQALEPLRDEKPSDSE